MSYIFLGAPGVGKGTYAQLLSKTYHVPHISTGDLLREEVKKESDVGLKAKKFMDKGDLVPDKIMIEMLRKRFEEDDCKKGFFLDGFPRTIRQADALEDITDLKKAIHFKADDSVIIFRITQRITCRGCGEIYHLIEKKPKKEGRCDLCGGELYQREDQKEEIVQKRLDVYRKETAPLIDYYNKKGMLFEITVNEPIAKIRDWFLKKMEEVIQFD